MDWEEFHKAKNEKLKKKEMLWPESDA